MADSQDSTLFDVSFDIDSNFNPEDLSKKIERSWLVYILFFYSQISH